MNDHKHHSSVAIEIISTPLYIKRLIIESLGQWKGEVKVEYIGKIHVHTQILDITFYELSLDQLAMSAVVHFDVGKKSGFLRGQAEGELEVKGDINLIWDDNTFSKIHLDIQEIELSDTSDISIASIPISEDIISSILSRYQGKIDDAINAYVTSQNLNSWLSNNIPQSLPIFGDPVIYFHPVVDSLIFTSLTKDGDTINLMGNFDGLGRVDEIKVFNSGNDIPIKKASPEATLPDLKVDLQLSMSWLNAYIKKHLKLGDQLPTGVRIDEVIIASRDHALEFKIVGDLKGLSLIIMQVELASHEGQLIIQDMRATKVEGQVIAKGLFNLSRGFVINKIKSVVDDKLQDFQALINKTFRKWEKQSIKGLGITINTESVTVDKATVQENSIKLELSFHHAIVMVETMDAIV